MDPIPIYSTQESFYVPQFAVYVRGQKLKANILNDILQVTYKDSIKDIDSFDLEVSNWDAEFRTFKFAPPLKTPTEDYSGVFDPGAPIELWMGYGDDLRQIMRGQITTLDLNFPESGAPTMTVHALNELHQFRTEEHTRSWQKWKDTDIAKQLCGLSVKKGQAGLGLPIRTNPSADETAETFVFMNNQHDIVFLMQRARRHGYEVFLENNNGTQTLFFGQSESKALKPVYNLEWGKSLLNFRPTLNTWNQVGKVTVRGWDRKANKAIEESFTVQELWKQQHKSTAEIARLTKLTEAFGNRTEVITDKPVHTKDEAKKLARDSLDSKGKRMVEAKGATVGLPDLRSGCALRITGFGVTNGAAAQAATNDFDGEYYVTETTHTLGNGGYRTEFSARREGDIKPAAAPKKP